MHDGDTAPGEPIKAILSHASSTAGAISHSHGVTCFFTTGWRFLATSSTITVISTAPTKRLEKTPRVRKTSSAIATRQDSPATQELRKRIFPTLYAIFQQSRGQQLELKVKNRSLRSLTRSCLYHRSEDQLQRTLEDAEALFNKYCSVSLKD